MTAEEPRESFLTVAEVAQILRLNQQTVRNWIDAGTLPATRVGRRVRIKQSDLDLIVEQGYSGTPSASPDAAAAGPSADDFWGGESINAAEPSFVPGAPRSRPAADADSSEVRTDEQTPETAR